MLRHPQPRVSISRHGTVLFNPAAVSKFLLRDGRSISVGYSLPKQCLFFRQLPTNAAGVPLRTNAKGALVAELGADILEEEFGLLSRRKAYAAVWDEERQTIVVSVK